ncbi:hypothetical protein BDA96_01G179500 [Sorghum bicolor]|uniref:Uncharacterized protein n=1 Tax=Sorghum bicolor TaxID=4558 RepID=A0A921UYI4_SORBI|nr:hypothetical protein BDA96_01G179500 [Sorghum bicolor]
MVVLFSLELFSPNMICTHRGGIRGHNCLGRTTFHAWSAKLMPKICYAVCPPYWQPDGASGGGHGNRGRGGPCELSGKPGPVSLVAACFIIPVCSGSGATITGEGATASCASSTPQCVLGSWQRALGHASSGPKVAATTATWVNNVDATLLCFEVSWPELTNAEDRTIGLPDTNQQT